MSRLAWTTIIFVVLPFVAPAQTSAPQKPQTLRSIRQTYLNQSIVVSGSVLSRAGTRVLREWVYAKGSQTRYEADLYNHLPASYQGKIARVIAVQMNELYSNGSATNALGEIVPEDDLANPYFDLVAQLDDGKLGLVTTYIESLQSAVVLQSEHNKRLDEMNTRLPSVIGKPLYAISSSRIYEPDSTLEQMTGKPESLKRLSLTAVPMLEPLLITAAKYIEPVDGVVLKLKLPDGEDALAFTDSMDLEILSKNETSFISRIRGSLLVSIPSALTPAEVDAIKRHEVFRGMSKRAVYFALGLSDKENDWGKGGKQLIFFHGSIFVYLDNQDVVVDWQSFDKK